MSDYAATAQRMEGGWWMVQCDQHPGALSQVRRLDQAAAEHQEAIAFVTGEPVEHVRVTITTPARKSGWSVRRRKPGAEGSRGEAGDGC